MASPKAKPSSQDFDHGTLSSAAFWLVLGLGANVACFVKSPSLNLQQPQALFAIYLVIVTALDLFLGASRKMTLQQVSPIAVLAILLTPGFPPVLAVIVNLVGTLVLLVATNINPWILAQAGRRLLPTGLTALFLIYRDPNEINTALFAAEIFLLTALLTRAKEGPFRADVFLVVSYPALAIMLRALADLHFGYVLLAVPLLFLLTTVDTSMLLRYFKLQKKLDDSRSEIQETKKAHQASERESRRKAVLLVRREKQLELLNGLGSQLDQAQAASDLGRFLIEESVRLTGAERAVMLLSEGRPAKILRVLSPIPLQSLNLQEGQAVPPGVQSGLEKSPPWRAQAFQNCQSFLCVPLGQLGWLVLAHSEREAFPDFLEEFFSAVGRHAGSALLALQRLTKMQEIARRELREKEMVAEQKERVAEEKEKVAEQNRNLRALISSFDHLTEEALAEDADVVGRGAEAIRKLTGADFVTFLAPPREQIQVVNGGYRFGERDWASVLHLEGSGPVGNLLCLSGRSNCFSSHQLEWCTLLRDFLDKTIENSTLHSKITESLKQLKDTQQEVVRSSQWAAAGRLAANAAHELNTPLGAIRLAAEQVKFFQGEGAPEPAKQGLASIIRSVDRCREVTDRLLITSRPVDRQDETTKSELQSLLPIVKDAIASVEPYLKTNNIGLTTHRLVEDVKAYCILQDTYWAVVNLLKNAIDALNDSDTSQKRIAVSLEQRPEFAVVTISDNGPGIPAEIQERIFEPFFTTKRLGQGNGLGLSLSRRNLRSYGGDVKVVSEVQTGASFQIWLPLVEKSRISSELSASEQRVSGSR